ncbi:hypothetical protein AAE478_002349 [Parahypoxylon ruwenzoriense]
MSKLAEWTVELVSANEGGCRFYLDHYKPFRLAAFGSTFAREINFTDDDWLSRIRNPLSKTPVAVCPHDKRVLSATSLIGPLPNAIPASDPSYAVSEMRSDSDQHKNPQDEASPVSFQIAGVYTIPEARDQGIAKALVKIATEQATDFAK